jgi:hypothetical protein
MEIRIVGRYPYHLSVASRADKTASASELAGI